MKQLISFLQSEAKDRPFLIQLIVMVLGASLGVLVGFFVSDKADKFEQTYLEEADGTDTIS